MAGRNRSRCRPLGHSPLGRIVRRHDEHHAGVEQRRQEPAQHHRVGDVGHVEFVEADEPPALGDARGHGRQRIDLALQRMQVRVHVAHERVEMDAHLAPDRHRREEAVHQEALAAPDAAPQVDAARHVGRGEQAGECRFPRRAEFRQFIAEPLQPLQRRGLRGIQPGMAAGEERFEIFDKRARGARRCCPEQRLRSCPARGGDTRRPTESCNGDVDAVQCSPSPAPIAFALGPDVALCRVLRQC